MNQLLSLLAMYWCYVDATRMNLCELTPEFEPICFLESSHILFPKVSKVFQKHEPPVLDRVDLGVTGLLP